MLLGKIPYLSILIRHLIKYHKPDPAFFVNKPSPLIEPDSVSIKRGKVYLLRLRAQ